MKREIKFRVWDNVDYMSNPFTLHDIQTKAIQFTSDCQVMQYIGLNDKNGKEIYEGDIYEYEGWHGGIEHTMYEGRLKEIGKSLNWMERRVILCHPHGNFITRKLDDITDMDYVGETFNHSPVTSKEWTVIGNIYETPELLISDQETQVSNTTATNSINTDHKI